MAEGAEAASWGVQGQFLRPVCTSGPATPLQLMAGGGLPAQGRGRDATGASRSEGWKLAAAAAAAAVHAAGGQAGRRAWHL